MGSIARDPGMTKSYKFIQILFNDAVTCLDFRVLVMNELKKWSINGIKMTRKMRRTSTESCAITISCTADAWDRTRAVAVGVQQ